MAGVGVALLLLLGGCAPEAAVADPSARLHDEIPSLVVVSWDQLAPGQAWVEYSIDADVWLRSPMRTVDAGPQEQILLGIPYDTPAQWRVVSDTGAGAVPTDEEEIVTGPLPEGTPRAEVLESDPSRWDSTGAYLYTAIFSRDHVMSRLIVDRAGRVVWVQQNPEAVASYSVRVSLDGQALLYDWIDYFGDTGEKVYRIRIDGTVEDVVEVPGHHHAFVELDDGSLVWGRYPSGGSGERLEKRSPGWEVETIWESPAGWTSNALFWDAERDVFLYSFYNNMTVIEVDHTTGSTLRSWGQASDWQFVPSSAQFEWQHGVSITAAGTLLVSTHASPDSSEGVVREYEIDDEAQALVQVWSVGEGEGISAPTYGEAHRLPGGNTLQNYGSNVRVREFTPDGAVVWDVVWTDEAGGRCDVIGRSVFLEDLYALLPAPE